MDRYLGSEPAKVVAHLRSRAPQWFALAEDGAAYASSLLQRLDIHVGEVRELLASLLFQRVVAGFEAVLLLGERGMHTQGLVQRRAILEALFVLGAIVQKAEYVERFLAADDARVLEIYKKMKRLPAQVRDALEPEITPPMIEAKMAELTSKTGGRKGPTTADYAKAAGLEIYYLTDYSFSSEVTHSVAKDLERHIQLDGAGDIDGMRWGPEDVPAPELFLHAIDYVLMACFAVEELFKKGPTTELEALRSRANKLIESEHAG